MKEKIKLIYRILIVLVSGIGLYLNFKFLTFEKGILYFTNLSNLFCMIYFLILVILMLTKKVKRTEKYYIFKGMATMAITLTMIVYNLLLSSSGVSAIFADHRLECSIVHIVVPLMVIFDYIIFGEKGHLKREYPLIWSLVLVAYQLFVTLYTIHGGTFINGATYPYPFMDIDTYGIGKVTINMIITFVFFLGYGTIVQMMDNKLGKNKQKFDKKNKKC